jgi:hypothetical protein
MKVLVLFLALLCAGSVRASTAEPNTPDTYPVDSPSAAPYPAPSNTNLTCTLCHDVVSIVEFELKEANATIETLEALVEALCKVLGSPPVRTECDEILADLKEIVSWILQGLDPAEICQKLFKCPASTFSTYSPPTKCCCEVWVIG